MEQWERVRLMVTKLHRLEPAILRYLSVGIRKYVALWQYVRLIFSWPVTELYRLEPRIFRYVSEAQWQYVRLTVGR